MKCVRLCDVPAGCCKKLCPSSKVIYYIDRDIYIWGKLCVNKCGSTIKIRNESRLKIYNDILGKDRELIVKREPVWNQGLDFYVDKIMTIESDIELRGFSNNKDAVLEIHGSQGADNPNAQFIASKIRIKDVKGNGIDIYNVDMDIDHLEISGENPSELLKKFSQPGYALQVSKSKVRVQNIGITHNAESSVSLKGPASLNVEKQATFMNGSGAAVNYANAKLGDNLEFQKGVSVHINTAERSIGLELKTMNAYSDDDIFVNNWPKDDAEQWIMRHPMTGLGRILVEEEFEEEDD